MAGIRFDHIAIGVERLALVPSVLVGALGGLPERGRPSSGFTWATWRFDGGARIEILEPLGRDGFLHRFLAARGPGIHHVTFKVPSLDEACRRAEARGYAIVGRDDSDAAWKEAFLHPKQAQGIVVQIVEPGPGAAGGDRPFRPPPPGPADPPPPVRVLGLRLRAHSRERAMTQWGAVLQGACREGPEGLLVFRWQRSPMRIAVEVDPVGGEGPIAVDFASDRPVAVPPGPIPPLGTVFCRRPEEPAG